MGVDRYTAFVSELEAFAAERDWTRLHTPRNLALAVAGEVGELCSELQWLADEDALAARHDERWPSIRDELADVFIYLARLAAIYDVDLIEAASAKMKINAERFPLGRPVGRS